MPRKISTAQRKPPDSMDAWDLVMRALSHFWRVTRQDNVVAQALLEKAIAIDPNYGQALGVLATSHTILRLHGLGGHGNGGSDRRARRAGGDPRRQRRSLGALRVGRAFICSRGASTIRSPSSSWRCSLNPNFALAQSYYGLALSFCGRWEDAYAAAHRALRLSPRDPFSAIYYGIAAYAHFVGRNYDEAMRLARESIRLRGDYVGGHRVLTAAAAMAGQDDVAKVALQELARARSPISRSPGSRARCRSSTTPTASTIWKRSAARA